MSENFSMQDVYLHSYLHLVGVSIFYYDYCITFPDEYSRFWSKPRSRASIMFFINRYVTFFGDIAVNVGNFYPFKTEESCRRYALYRQLLLILAQVIVCVNLLMRTYALYRRDKRVLASILVIGFTLLGLSCWAVIGQQESIDLNGGCHTAAPRVTAIRTAVAWEALFIYDIMIFSLTIFKTFKERSLNPISTGKFDVVSLIFRDGAMYFAIMASANLANVVTFYVLQVPLATCAASRRAYNLTRALSSIPPAAAPRRPVHVREQRLGDDDVAPDAQPPRRDSRVGEHDAQPVVHRELHDAPLHVALRRALPAPRRLRARRGRARRRVRARDPGGGHRDARPPAAAAAAASRERRIGT